MRSSGPTRQAGSSIGRRIAIVGPGGSGKTSLAHQLSASGGLPVAHLDVYWYRPGWVTVSPADAIPAVREVTSTDAWIVEGAFLAHFENDGRTRADTVIYLDRSPALCIIRTLRRWLLNRKRHRVDLPAGCAESLDWDNLVWIARFRRVEEPKLVRILAGLPDHVAVHRLRSAREVQRLVVLAREGHPR